MPSKGSRSALYYYADEYRRKQQKNAPGNKLMSIAEAIRTVYPTWQNMSAVQKAPYEEMYMKYKKETAKTRLNSLGQSVARTENPLEEALSNRRREFIVLQKYFSSLSREELLNKPFYFVHFNVFCAIEDCTYIPAEFAICEWTLNAGLIQSYCCLIEPGKVPLGYYGDCVQNSRNTHEIPLDSPGKENAIAIWIRLCDFVKLDPLGEPPKLYSLEADCKITKAAIQWIRDSAMEKRHNFFKDVIFSAESLLCTLGDVAGKNLIYESAGDVLSEKTHAYKTGVCCRYHEEIDNINCSLCVVKHICFGMSMSACSMLDVPSNAPGHLPPNH